MAKDETSAAVIRIAGAAIIALLVIMAIAALVLR